MYAPLRAPSTVGTMPVQHQQPHHTLSFKNSFQLFLEGNLSDYFQALDHVHGDRRASLAARRFIGGRLRKWRLHHVEEVFIMVPAGLEPSRDGRSATHEGDQLLELEGILKRNGLRVYLTPLAALSSGDFVFQTKFNRAITDGLKRHPSSVLFIEESRKEVQRSLATLLLTPGNGVAPEKAIQYITGRTRVVPADLRVFQYKHYLNPDYSLPSRSLFLTNGKSVQTRKSEADPEKPAVDEDTPEAKTETNVAPDSSNRVEPTPVPTPAPDATRPEPQPATPESSDAAAEQNTSTSAQADQSQVASEPRTPTSEAAHTEAPEADSSSGATQTLKPVEVPAESPDDPPTTSAATSVATKSSAEEPVQTTVAESPAPPPGPSPAPPKPAAPARDATEGPLSQADPLFQTSGLTIKVKMVGIISSIILLALGAMALLATYFFREDSVVRIQENNLALTEVIGGRVESEFENISYKGLLLATNLVESNTAQQEVFTELFFRNNANIIFVGVARPDGGGLAFDREQFNETFLADKQIEREDIQRLHGLGAASFTQSFSGGTIVQNVSPGFPLPVLGLSLPFNNGTIVVLYLYLNEDPEQGRFLRSFSRETTKLATAFLVDSEGKIIAHPELDLVKAGTDYIQVPIVESAMQSTNPNGLTQFAWEDTRYLGSFRKLNFASLSVISIVDEAKALKAVEDIQRRNIIITLIVVLTSVLIVYFFARTISVPILRLVDATRQVEGGDYGVTIEPAARDEVGELTNSFVLMASGLAERERVKDALGKFVNKEIAELASAGQIHLGGERKQAAVFFSDLRGFTAMSEGRTPEEVVSILNEYFTEMVATIEETNGVVDKFIGDAIMAHWGAVKTVGNDTENAINAGLLMRKALIKLNEANAGHADRPMLKMGSGINTGPVISGQIGSDNRFEFTVIGDAVNLASRIEALNKPFGTDLLISQDSYDLVKDIFKVEPMPAIKVKGKSEPQTIYAIIGRNDDPDCPRDLEHVRELLGIEFDAAKAGGGEEKEVKYEILENK